MTTVAVARLGGQVAMAADTLVTFGDTKLSHRYESNSKIFKVGSSYVGMAGTVAHFPVLRHALTAMPADELKLGNKDEIFATFTKLHAQLKEKFFLQTKEEDADPYESSQYTVLIANAQGIFGVYSYREIFEFKDFWAIGSGRNFALGAMHAARNTTVGKVKTAKDLVMAGVSAGCEFDKNSSTPIDAFSIKLKALKG
jgi:ATP-dependent HslUV protease, peptidase subunit HslV